MEMYYFENELLIALVKERPILWDKSIEHYKCRNSTAFAWKEVCSKLHENYNSLVHHEKETFGRYVMKKWTNLKDCWWRSSKRGADGTNPGIRPYRYYKELIFLKKNRAHSNGTPLTSSDLQESDSNGSDNLRTDIVETALQAPDVETHEQKLNHETSCNGRITPSTFTENRHISFIKGILPALQLLNEDQVLQFQMDVLRVLQRIKHLNRSESCDIVFNNS